MNWYELNEKERIQQVYSKYTIEDFWNWWSDKKFAWMEIRIKDIKLIKETRKKFKLNYSSSGVYVKNSKQLKQVIAYCRDKATIWCGIQPRIKNWNVWGNKSFGSGTKGGSADVNVDCVSFLFIDIDRKIKEKSATNEELKNCNILVNSILERLSLQNWNKNYCKICSGNGVQLLIKLDIPIKLPVVIFDNKTKTFLENSEFDSIRNTIRNGIGEQIHTFGNKINAKLNLGVELDVSSFKIMVVGALHCTKNYKYDGFTWRGIVELKNDGINNGLSDYIMSMKDNIVKNKKIFYVERFRRTTEYNIRSGELMKNPIVRFMLDNQLPYGMINNKIWFALKILLRDSNFDLNSDEFKQFHKSIETKYKGEFTLNLPDKKFKFTEMVVNHYCVENLLPLVYLLYPRKSKKLNMCFEDTKFESYKFIETSLKLSENTDIWQDMENYKHIFIENETENKLRLTAFTKSCVEKYGIVKTKYYFDTLFNDFFSYI